MSMFCFQCQEAQDNVGCSTRGICGKSEDVAKLQDALIHMLKGIAVYSDRLRGYDIRDEATDVFLMDQLFTTITNANFDPGEIHKAILEAQVIRESAMGTYLTTYSAREGNDFSGALPDPATWSPAHDREALLTQTDGLGILSQEDEDIRSLRELLIIGLKGIAAYAHHAYLLEFRDEDIFAFFHEALAATANDSLSADDLTSLVLKAGKISAFTLSLLDRAHTDSYGHPEPTDVRIDARERPGILISGHDLRDLEDLLKQTEDTGVDVYTHGEMLPAHAYPAFKGYEHFVGNYGGSWWMQNKEFESFNGPIIMTTNCIVPPRSSYANRIYTTGMVRHTGLKHIPDRTGNGGKDFSEIIQLARGSEPPRSLEAGTIPIGCAHETLLCSTDMIIDAIKRGKISRMFVMAGCDGRNSDRDYYTELAKNLPEDSIILTAGCAKYRYNKLDLGEIEGIPRILDAGQCNDSYSLAVMAMKLMNALGAESINDLPISFDIAWYEQKAVTVLLALLHLGVKGIRLGPTLPAFLSPNVAKLLVDTFDIKPISSVEDDISAMMKGE